jgi:hypothetical protein
MCAQPPIQQVRGPAKHKTDPCFLIAHGSVNVSTRLRVGRSKKSGSNPSRVKKFFFSTTSRPALRLVEPGALSLGVKKSGRETDHSPSSAEDKNGGAVPRVPHMPSRRDN